MSSSRHVQRLLPWRRSLVVALLAVAALSTAARACSVPVFRYALEHWEADAYVAVVFHRGPLTSDQQTLVDQLAPTSENGRTGINLLVQTVDLDAEPDAALVELWKQHNTDTLPLISLQTPPRLGPPQTAWQAELTADNVAALQTSPIREQFRKRLLGGESVVWVFLESGDKPADDESFALLQKELARLQDVIELPPIEEEDLKELTVDPAELKIAFSTIRLARDNPQEQPLVEMLLRVEPDLLEEPFVHQVMAFPVFGRGRALYALVGAGITAETIEDASRFLTGACQCTVKAQNPGVDLLMAVDWDGLVTPALPYDDSQPVLSGLTSFIPDDAQAGQTSVMEEPASAVTDAVESEDVAEPAGDGALQAQVDDLLDGNGVDGEQRQQQVQSQRTGEAVQGSQSLTINITLLLGLVVAGVLLATLFITWKSR